MSFDLSIFNANLPAHIQARQEKARQANAALAAGVSVGFPVLSIKGKVWHMQRDGERTAEGECDAERSGLRAQALRRFRWISRTETAAGVMPGKREA